MTGDPYEPLIDVLSAAESREQMENIGNLPIIMYDSDDGLEVPKKVEMDSVDFGMSEAPVVKSIGAFNTSTFLAMFK